MGGHEGVPGGQWEAKGGSWEIPRSEILKEKSEEKKAETEVENLTSVKVLESVSQGAYLGVTFSGKKIKTRK